jgi:hypothetical protein
VIGVLHLLGERRATPTFGLAPLGPGVGEGCDKGLALALAERLEPSLELFKGVRAFVPTPTGDSVFNVPRRDDRELALVTEHKVGVFQLVTIDSAPHVLLILPLLGFLRHAVPPYPFYHFVITLSRWNVAMYRFRGWFLHLGSIPFLAAVAVFSCGRTFEPASGAHEPFVVIDECEKGLARAKGKVFLCAFDGKLIVCEVADSDG